MKDITNLFTNKDILFSKLEEVAPKELKSRKNMQVFDGEGIDNNYYAIFVYKSKARFVQKSVNEFEELFLRLVSLKGHNYKYKYIIISEAGLCSKAKGLLKTLGWSII